MLGDTKQALLISSVAARRLFKKSVLLYFWSTEEHRPLIIQGDMDFIRVLFTTVRVKRIKGRERTHQTL